MDQSLSLGRVDLLLLPLAGRRQHLLTLRCLRKQHLPLRVLEPVYLLRELVRLSLLLRKVLTRHLELLVEIVEPLAVFLGHLAVLLLFLLLRLRCFDRFGGLDGERVTLLHERLGHLFFQLVLIRLLLLA